jgi:hypothetical protein
MTDIPIHKKNHPARKQCLACKRMFTPDPRIGQRQKYCSNKKCQSKRQRLHDATWLGKPENTIFRALYQRRWREDNPEYLKEWRRSHPESVQRNCDFMREYMREKRQLALFEKTRQIHLQITKDKGVMYVNGMNTWILLHLRRQGIWSKALALGYVNDRIKTGSVRLPQGRLYKVSGVA